tara:strand:- start:863 stop:2089 length:1227 start_codon:yes stop_codon:yes gene_type:complete
MPNILSWEELRGFSTDDFDRVNGKTNSYSNLRLFNHDKNEAELILYRDRHAWCPYCQKIWLWLELKQIPYKIKKINMFCYGKKENWYLNKVNSGKLPAIELKGQIVTESDLIISFLEKEYGVLGSSIFSKKLEPIRKIEREIFRDWCNWLCRENIFIIESAIKQRKLKQSLKKLEDLINNSSTGFLDPINEDISEIYPGTGDIIFIPYIERLNASLCYYKGFSLREEFPKINKWLTLLENQCTYLGTQGDFHTHTHDLPPQMGGCFKEENPKQQYYSNLIDNGHGLGNLEINTDNDLHKFSKISLHRVMKHKKNIIRSNPCDKDLFELGLRSALTYLSTGEINKVNDSCSIGLRFLRDRISVPRDMPIISARILRFSLEKIASLGVSKEIYNIPKQHRYDQNPLKFKT